LPGEPGEPGFQGDKVFQLTPFLLIYSHRVYVYMYVHAFVFIYLFIFLHSNTPNRVFFYLNNHVLIFQGYQGSPGLPGIRGKLGPQVNSLAYI